jgi:GDP-4-dehydro-6-deoxy-D-mannose reductase
VSRAVVTGANGFVGLHLVRHLRAAGDDVVAVDRDVDVTDAGALVRVLEAARPDAIYHLAALSHVGRSWDEPDAVRAVNVGGTAHVLEAARRAVPRARVLVVSSAEVYGVTRPEDQPLAEGRALAPVSPYAASKAEAEAVALEAVARGQDVVIVRPFNHVGPGQSPSFFVPALVTRLYAARGARRGRVAVGDLSARRDLTDVRDVVRAYRLVLEESASSGVYNVATGVDHAMGEVAARLVAMVAPGTELVLDPRLVRPVEVPVSRGDAARLRGETGWRPEVSLERSLSDVVADLDPSHQE